MEKKDHLIVVIGRNYSNGLAVVRSLGAAGYTVDFIASAYKKNALSVVKSSKYVHKYTEVVSDKVGADGKDRKLLNAIMKYADQGDSKVLLFPTDDYTTTIIDKNREQLDPYFLMPSVRQGKPGELSDLMDKKTQSHMAREAGLLTAHTTVISIRDDIVIPEDVVYPCYVKPKKSIEGFKTEMAICEDRETLEAHLSMMKSAYSAREVIVQEYIDVDYEFASAGVCLDQEVILPALIRKTAIGRHGRGVTLTGELVPADEIGEDMLRHAIDLLKSFHYTGNFGMEFLVSKGKVYFNEVNLRSAGEGYSYYKSGVNLPAIFADEVFGESDPDRNTVFEGFGKTILYDKIAWEDYVYGYITKEELDQFIDASDIMILCDEEDPKPGERFIKKSTNSRKRREERLERCIQAAAEGAGWDRDRAEREIEEARERTGIKYNEYRFYRFWEIPPEQQVTEYARLRWEEQNDPEVVVLSRSSTTGLGVIRSLGEAGNPVIYVANKSRKGRSNMVQSSKYPLRSMEVRSRQDVFGDDPMIRAALLELGRGMDHRTVLVPTDNYSAAVADANREALDAFFYTPYLINGEPGQLVDMMRKTVQRTLAADAGFDTVLQWVLSKDDEIRVPDDIVFPCICKFDLSVSKSSRFRQVCNNDAELMECLSEMRLRYEDAVLIIQSFVETDSELSVCGIMTDHQDVVVPGVIRSTLMADNNNGTPLTGKTEPVDVLGENLERITRLIRAIGYVGPFEVELFASGDRIVFNEVNFGYSKANYALLSCGINLPALAARALRGLPLKQDSLQAEEFGQTFVNENAVWGAYSNNLISEEERKLMLASASIRLIENEADPGPFQYFQDNVPESSENRRQRRIKKERWDRFRLHPGSRSSSAQDALAQKKNSYGMDDDISEDDDEENEEFDERDSRENLPYHFWEMPLQEQLTEYHHICRQMFDATKTVVLSRKNTAGLGVVRSLGALGRPVIFVGDTGKEGRSSMVRKSRHLQAADEVISREEPSGSDSAVRSRLLTLGQSLENKAVLLPADNYSAAVIDANRDYLDEYYWTPYVIDGAPGELIHMMSKGYQRALALEAGFDVCKEWRIPVGTELAIPEDIVYPCICKTDLSIGTFKKYMQVCHNDKELLFSLRTMRTKYQEAEIIIQEYIQSDSELSVCGVADREQEILIPVVMRNTHVADYDRGVPLAGVVEPASILGDELDRIIQLVKQFRYVGSFEVELFQAGSRLYFNEVNFGFSSSNYAGMLSNVNLPAMTADVLQNLPVDPAHYAGAVPGLSYVSENAVWSEYAHNNINRGELKSLLGPQRTRLIENETDPAPARRFEKRVPRRSERRRKNLRKAEFKETIRPYLGSPVRAIQGYPQGKRKNRRNPNSEYPRIMVAGRNWCSNLCMAKSLARAGYEIEVLHVLQKKLKSTNIQRWLRPEKYSDCIKAYYICNSMRNSVRIVERLIELADENRKMLLVPVDDLVAFAVDEYYAELSEYYILPSINNTPGALIEMMSKGTQKALAREAGLPVVNDCIISSDDETITIPDSVTYPCFIKPNISRNSFKTKMKRCDSREELQATLEERRGTKYELLVEDYIDIKREFSYLGLSTPEGVVCPGYFEAVVEGEESHRGVALLGRILPTSAARPLIDQVRDFVGTLNYTGLFDVDLIEDTSGKLYFVELNLRYGGSGFAFTQIGMNLPAMYADYMLKGKPIDLSLTVDEAGQTFVNEKVLMDEYIESLIEYDEIDETMNAADICFVCDKEDMRPYKHLKSRYPKATELRKILAEKKEAQLRKEIRGQDLEAADQE